MPVSSKLGKKEIVEWISLNKNEISKILDIGVGSGIYAKLLRNNKIINDITIVGVEIWKPYISKFNLNELYDTIIQEDARKIDYTKLGRFDLTFAGDVLEHMTKEEAINLVENILSISKTLIISIPIIYMPQDEYEGNPYEIHVKPDWSDEEVKECWNHYIKKSYIGYKKTSPRIGVYWLQK
jgi:predicted TPR repeat methyltransferase